MAQDYKNYLAANVLNENQTVSYRKLGRALRIHNNLAKQMLFEFQRLENSRKPNSVHATYFLSGIRKVRMPVMGNGQHQKGGEDVPMQSSPFLSSSMPQQEVEEVSIPAKTIMLVAEDDLSNAKALFEDLQSVHIYSLQPTPLPNLDALTDVDREISITFTNEDPLEYGVKYGIIQNKNVKRRTGRKPPSAPMAAMFSDSLPQAKSSQTLEPKTEKGPGEHSSRLTLKPEDMKDLQVSKNQTRPKTQDSQRSSSKSVDKPPGMKRDTSDIFKSFSKSKPKVRRQDTDSSNVDSPPNSAEPSAVEDAEMKDASEEEEGDEHYLDRSMMSANSQTGKTRNQRQEELRKLMDEDDEIMADSQEAASPEKEVVYVSPSQGVESTEAGEPSSMVHVGRRRGRRQVKKKKTVKDDEGYLVTREELAWESFSEEEPAPSKLKSSGLSSSQASNGGKSSGKPGQGKGNIMSFFSKK